jgi:hypothetical protein
MTTINPSADADHFLPGSTAAQDLERVAEPYCDACKTDEFIYIESFMPCITGSDGHVKRLGEVTYFCTACDGFAGHAVPASWAPPGWYLG